MVRSVWCELRSVRVGTFSVRESALITMTWALLSLPGVLSLVKTVRRSAIRSGSVSVSLSEGSWGSRGRNRA